MKKKFIDWNYLIIEFSKNIDKFPPQILKKKYNLDTNTFSRLLLKIPTLKKLNNDFKKNLTHERAFRYTKYLIEEELKFKIDKNLPKKISKDIFKGQYFQIYTYALEQIKKDSYWNQFPAISFLICRAFPNKYLPTQFWKQAKFNYFDYKKNILNTMIDIFYIENEVDLKKTKIDKEALSSMILDKHGTFSDPNIRAYGISRKYWEKTFKTKNLKTLREALVLFLGLQKNQKRENKKVLITNLKKQKIDPYKCYLCERKTRIEIHHIINVKQSSFISKSDNINDGENLIPLCVYHHDDARNINLIKDYNKNGFSNLRELLLKKIN